MLRSVLTFRSFGFDIIPRPVTISDSFSSIEKTSLALHEYAAWSSYVILGRLKARTEIVVLPYYSSEETTITKDKLSS